MALSIVEAADVNAAKLGSAVHPRALWRLHELFPFALVNVQHITHQVPLGSYRMDGPRFRPEHETAVLIYLEGDREGACVGGESVCHPDDTFDRRKGITLAYARALDVARQVHAVRAIEKKLLR